MSSQDRAAEQARQARAAAEERLLAKLEAAQVGAADADFSGEEKSFLRDAAAGLRADQLKLLFRWLDLKVSGSKAELVERLDESLGSGTIQYVDLVVLLNTVEPWNKQHVQLYVSPADVASQWRSADFVRQRLQEVRLADAYGVQLPIALPDNLHVVSVVHEDDELVVTAVRRQTELVRDETKDEQRIENGQTIVLKGSRLEIRRRLTVLRWHLVTGAASLHVSQLAQGARYAEAIQDFKDSTEAWLPWHAFRVVDLREAVRQLHTQVSTNRRTAEVRAYGLSYKSEAGRRYTARSAGRDQDLLGEEDLDEAVDVFRQHALARLGGFYWLPNRAPAAYLNPLFAEVHTVLVAEENRINLTMPHDEQVIRYVLRRVRDLS